MSESKQDRPIYCAPRRTTPPPMPEGIGAERLRALARLRRVWPNGRTIRYHFMEGPWQRKESWLQRVREAVRLWEEVGLGIAFEETDDIEASDVRIGFRAGDGHWSYVGRDIENIGTSRRTMNLDTNFDLDTALHEWGHSLALEHEHQNPFAGIVWDEPAVIAALAGSPNFWDESKTRHNILDKIDPLDVTGSEWDGDSIMHYPFEEGLIVAPEALRGGHRPAPGLSDDDKEVARKLYPPASGSSKKLAPLESVRVQLAPSEQITFLIQPTVTRHYHIATFGASGSVLSLMEKDGTAWREIASDDDGGTDTNAHIHTRLRAGEEFELNVRLYYQGRAGDLAVMYW